MKGYLQLFDEVHIISPFDFSPQRREEKRIFIYPVGVRGRRIFPVNIRLVSRLVDNKNVSLISAFDELEMGAIGSITGKLKKTASVISVHTDWRAKIQPTRKGYYYLRLMERTSFSLSDRILPISEFLKSKVVTYGCQKEKLLVLHNRVDTRLFDRTRRDPDIKKKLNSTGPIVLYVGRLAEDKRVDYVIECAPYVLGEKPNARFILIGDGPLRSRLQKRVNDLGLSANVAFLGVVEHDVLPYYYTAADVVVCPYSGNVLLEAMASGTPVVGFDIEWHSEVIQDGQTGILVEYGDAVSMAQAILSMLQDRDLRKRLGENARKLVVSEYGWETVTEQELSILREVLEC